MIGSIILINLVFTCIVTVGILLLTRSSKLTWKNEIRIGAIGTVWFTYIAWACIYMAQYRPKYEKAL